jgi:phage baseplate assembly protein W
MYQPIYSDVSRVDPRNHPMVFDLDSIQQSLDMIVRTPARQRLFYPWGQTFDNILFSLDFQTLYRVQTVVFEALLRDPRVTLSYNNVSVISDPQNHTFTVTAWFNVKGLSGQQFRKVWTVGQPQ